MGSISVETLLALGGAISTIIAAVWHLQGSIGKQISELRQESSAGRQKIYDRMDEIARDSRESIHRLRNETVSADTFHVSAEETARQVAGINDRLVAVEQDRGGRRHATRAGAE